MEREVVRNGSALQEEICGLTLTFHVVNGFEEDNLQDIGSGGGT